MNDRYDSELDVLKEAIGESLDSFLAGTMNREELEHELIYLAEQFSASIVILEPVNGGLTLARSRLLVRPEVRIKGRDSQRVLRPFKLGYDA